MSMGGFTSLTIHKDLSGGSPAAEGTSILELTTDPDIYNGEFPVLDVGELDASSTPVGTLDSDVQQLFFDIKNRDGTDMDQVESQPLRIFYASGRPFTGVTIECANATAWADSGTDPVGTLLGNGHTDALATCITTVGIAGAATDKSGYGYANLVVAAVSVAADITPLTDPKYGFVDYPLAFIEWPYLDKVDSGDPGWDDEGLTSNANTSLIFVRTDDINGEADYQFLGCSNRMTEFLEELSTEDVLKGKSAFTTVVTQQGFNVTFEMLSRSNWALQNIFNFDLTDTTTSFKNFKMPKNINLRSYYVVIRQQLKGGIARWWQFPRCNLIPDGTMGQDGTMAGAPITLKVLDSNVVANVSTYPVDYDFMAISYSVKVT